jgi:hypothetical protein
MGAAEFLIYLNRHTYDIPTQTYIIEKENMRWYC